MKQPSTITWGINFSQTQAEALGVDWKNAYLAMLQDLGVKHVKLLTQWDLVQPKQKAYFFDDLDWQVKQAHDHNANIIFVVGMKTGRWPECHVPGWAGAISKQAQQDEIVSYITTVVTRYKGDSAIIAWQAENEPLFRFGECPWYDKDFLKKEVVLIKSIDPSRPVIISDSGEASTWFNAARIGDKVSVTMYRKVWMHITDKLGFYFTWPLPASFYRIKAGLVESFFAKPVMCGELQAEPWLPVPFPKAPLADQEKSMDIKQFDSNVAFAKKTGIGEFYFWGPEWWYWLKTVQHKPEIWNSARKLFSQGG